MSWVQIVEHVRAIARAECERVLKMRTQPQMGNIVEWDPKTHRARVELQPHGVVTNWIPTSSPWVGNGWGLVTSHSVGDQVMVAYPEFGSNEGVITGRVFDERNPPPQVAKDNQMMLVGSDGSWLAFQPEGNKIRLHGTALVEIGNMGDPIRKLVIDTFQQLFNDHVHEDVEPGNGTSGKPTTPITNDHLTATLKGN